MRPPRRAQKLEIEHKNGVAKGWPETMILAKQFFASVRCAGRAVLISRGKAKLVKGLGGTPRFVPLDREFIDARGELSYLPNKIVFYGNDECHAPDRKARPRRRHRAFPACLCPLVLMFPAPPQMTLPEMMEQLPAEILAMFVNRVTVHRFQLNVGTSSKHNRESGPNEQTEARSLADRMRAAALSRVPPSDARRPRRYAPS